MRHIVFAFIRVEDWTTKLNQVVLTETGKDRIQALYEELTTSGIVIDSKGVRIFFEDHREDGRLHAEALAQLFDLESLGEQSAISLFTSGFRGMKAEIDSTENLEYEVMIFYVVRDGSTFVETIRYWNEFASLFGYNPEFYPSPVGIPLGFSIEIQDNPIQWMFKDKT
jgi:hypothetical protein